MVRGAVRSDPCGSYRSYVRVVMIEDFAFEYLVSKAAMIETASGTSTATNRQTAPAAPRCPNESRQL